MKNKVRKSISSMVFDTVNVIFMLLLTVCVLYPVLNVVAVSLSDASYIIRGEVGIIPKGINLASYIFVLNDPYVWSGYINSIVYSLLATLIMLTVTSMMAYTLTVSDFKIKKFLTVALTITLFFNGGMIPTYLLFRNMNMLNTIWVMILPGCLTAYNTFVFRTFFNSIPGEMRESALIDGANDLKILFVIILPLSKALLATFALFGIVGTWNSWFNALLYLSDQEKYPLQLILRNYLYELDVSALQERAGALTSADSTLAGNTLDPLGIRMAMVVATMFPIMMIYPFFQKYFVKGVMIGAVKG